MFEALEDVAEDIEAGGSVVVVPEDAVEVVGGEPRARAEVKIETGS